MPASAAAGFVEWAPPPGGSVTVLHVFGALLANEITLEAVIAASPAMPALSDDRPINEYCVIRRLGHR